MVIICVCVYVVKAPDSYSFSKFPVCNMVLLTIGTMLHIRALEFIHPTQLQLCTL